MIPGPLTEPLERGRSRPAHPGRAARWVALALAATGVLGAIGWVAVFSPLRLRRFAVEEASRIVTFPQGGTYVLFEESAGAGQRRLPPPVVVTVVGLGGAEVRVEPYAWPGDSSPTPTYRVGPYEGRAFARFHIRRPGEYLVRIETLPADLIPPGQYSEPPRGDYALGREITTTWVGSYAGLLIVAVLPASMSVIAASVSRQQRRAAELAPTK
ncbi:MAG: hypothetical protein N2037_01225 [Acidimicrobiales bacterium]|nr:hypothetical protein [Acidimicrobiales bacterium]